MLWISSLLAEEAAGGDGRFLWFPSILSAVADRLGEAGEDGAELLRE
jgi:hypothetical protein